MRKLTHEEYVKEASIKNPNIEILEKYAGNRTKILHRCKIHNYEFYTEPRSVRNYIACPLCCNDYKSKTKTKTHEQYIEELKIKQIDIMPIEQYLGTMIKIKHKCLLHNVEFITSPNQILTYAGGCPKCTSERKSKAYTKSHEQYTNDLYNKNNQFTVLEPYINERTKILHECLVCGYKWKVSPLNILNGSGCPNCHQKSKGENKIKKWLELHDINYDYQKTFNNCIDIKPLPFDFYIPDYNKCIEYDGIQHFKPIDYFGGQKWFEYTQRHDNIKTEFCNKNNIPLLRIPYYAKVEEELEYFLFN